MSEQRRYAIDEFLDEIKASRNNRGFLASLRKGMAETTECMAWPIVARQHFDFTNSALRRIWTTVGALSAMTVDEGLLCESYVTIGGVLRKIKGKNGGADKNKDENASGTPETKLRRLLNCADSGELCELVVNVIRQAVQKDVGVNCRMLYWDLVNWDDPDRREGIRIRWTRDFYAVYEEKEGDANE